ncbi:MAG: DUF4399 domain-containing protein [Rhodobacteraceae bacterium]|nr:DUF4399 domain-containing protein [Paracoccaceae bacterium]
MFKRLMGALALATAPVFAQAGDTAAPKDAFVYFINLEDGQTVSSPIRILFGLQGMGVAPAGTEKENTGHHHLLIDRPPMGQGEEDELDYGILADEHHMHFGGGQTEVLLDLDPGRHTLQLVLGDLNHVPHSNPIMSEHITITVTE